MSTRIAIALALLVSACSDSANTIVITNDPVGDAIDLGHANGTVVAARASSELLSDNYTTRLGKAAGILAELNNGMLDTSSFAADVVAEDDVFAFATSLIDDYNIANAQLDDVVRIYGIPYIDSTAQAQLARETDAALSLLRNTPPDQIDHAYTGLQVIMLSESQVVLDELFDIVGPGNMADYIIDTRDMVDAQLNDATSLLDTFF